MANKKTGVKFDIRFNDLIIEATKKDVKYARLRICKNQKIKFSIPWSFSQTQIENMLQKHYIWMKQTLNSLENMALPKNKISFLGKIYQLKFDEFSQETKIVGDKIISKNYESLEKFYKKEAKKQFSKFINFYQPIINRAIKRVCIKKMSSRWGSCNHKKGYINLNLYLIHKSENLIEYVVLHEMVHLIYPNHQKEFHGYIRNLMPDYKLREKALKFHLDL